MPLYEYQCESCAKRFERIQKFSDPPVETCPSCGGHVKKLMSSPAIQFKGSGWYITDYAKKANSEKTTSDTSAAKTEGTSGASAETGSSSTPASTPPAESPKKTDNS
jgi:putative FmdB family regulatory protein